MTALSGIAPAADPPAVCALIRSPAGAYLLQHRDDKPGIWFPGFWGLFGGLIEAGETPDQALRRELAEELDFHPVALRYFTQVAFDLRPFGHGIKLRYCFEVAASDRELAAMRLAEGQGMALVPPDRLATVTPFAPYDALAIGLHRSAETVRATPRAG